jgi:hypothetical protein
VICVQSVGLAFDKYLAISLDPFVSVAIEVNRRPNLLLANVAIQTNNQVWVAGFDGKAGVGQGVVNFFSGHDFCLP